MNALIQKAISNRLLLRVWYDPGVRLIEPHAYGYGSSGQLLLRAYQVDGASNSNEHEHWKLFREDRFEWIELEGGNFTEPRDGYKEDDKAMKLGIIAQLRNRKGRAQ